MSKVQSQYSINFFVEYNQQRAGKGWSWWSIRFRQKLLDLPCWRGKFRVLKIPLRNNKFYMWSYRFYEPFGKFTPGWELESFFLVCRQFFWMWQISYDVSVISAASAVDWLLEEQGERSSNAGGSWQIPSPVRHHKQIEHPLYSIPVTYQSWCIVLSSHPNFVRWTSQYFSPIELHGSKP